jgi:hypothetical protein
VPAEETQKLETELADARAKLAIEERMHTVTIRQRDAAEDCVERILALLGKGNGHDYEWSSSFGFIDAVELAEDALHEATREAAAEAIKTVGAQLERAEEQVKTLREALKRIERWDMPASGRFWDAEKTLPMSYASAFGSQGEQAVIVGIAAAALAATQPEAAK